MDIIEIIGTYEFDPPNLTTKHEKQSSWKKTAFIIFDCDLHMYYAWFIKKRFNLVLNKPIRYPHLSFINDKIDTPELLEKYNKVKNKYNGKKVSLLYSPELVRGGKEHWWLKCECKEAEQVRLECGLNKQPEHPFHITLGRTNHLTQYHSDYIIRQIIKFNL